MNRLALHVLAVFAIGAIVFAITNSFVGTLCVRAMACQIAQLGPVR